VERQFQAPPPGAPVDLADVFRRVGAKVELEDEPAANGSAVQPERPSEIARQPSAAAPATAKKEVEEESIDDYMSRLMQRVRSGADESGPATYTPPPPQSGRAGRGAAATAPPAESPKPPVAEEGRTASISPRTMAPEKRIDLSALRELANLSAQSAISRHSRQVLIGSMYSKLTVAIVALVTGAALLWMWKALDVTEMAYYSALVALLVAVYWGMEYALLSGRLTISKSGHIEIDWNKSPQRKVAAPPAADEAAEGVGPGPAVDDSPST
jgi:hypothetical protein